MQKFAYAKFFLAGCLFWSWLCGSAQPGALDLSFDPGIGANNGITAIALQADGKIIVAGGFDTYIYGNDTLVTRMVRLHTDGSLDTSFHSPGVDYSVFALAIQGDGKIIAGGEFSSYSGVTVNHICRINSNGSLDTSFYTGTGFNARVYDVVIQPDGKILAGGNFTDYNGTVCKRLARLNTDGSYDMSFNTAHGASSTVEAIELMPDGKILIGGDFSVYDTIRTIYDSLSWRVARVFPDGSRDTSFLPAFGAHAVVIDIDAQPDGKIIIGGDFDLYNFQQRGKIARLTGNADLEAGFHPGANSTIDDVEVLSDGRILATGNFTSMHGQPANRIAMLRPGGDIDTTFKSGTGFGGTGIGGFGRRIAIQNDGKIIIAGGFTSYNNINRKCIARIYSCLTSQPGLITGNDSVLCTQTIVYSVPPVADADSYEWTLPDGWSFIGTSNSNSITVISNGEGGIISVRAFSDSCGYSNPQAKTIHKIPPPAIPLCLVTVDTASTHNILLWEKPADKSLIDSFFIYRETSTSVYTKIGAVHRDSLSAYHDYAADPNVTSYRYKISVLDICGVESALSDFHNTIHLQNLGNGNFQWTFYDIENEPNPVTEFNIYRDNLGNGNFTQIGLVPGTNATFTDINSSFFPNSIYVVDVNWSRSCTPQRGPVNTTRSNIRRANRIDTLPQPPDTTGVGLQPIGEENFLVYPNPAEVLLTIEFNAPVQVERIQLFNTLGQVMYSEQKARLNVAHQKTISVATLPKGVYMLLVETDEKQWKRMVIVQ